MKTKSIKSPGSLVVRGRNFYTFWRVKGTDGKTKAVCKALRDENGAAITTRPEAEKAKARLMEIVAKQNQVESLRSIQHKIDDTQADIQRLKEEQHPALSLAQAWTAFVRSSERHDCGKATLGQYESKWELFRDWINREHPKAVLLRDVTSQIAEEYLQQLNRSVSPTTYNYYLHTLRYVFRTVKDDARLTEDVWAKAKMKTLVQFSRRELTIDELKKVCGAAQGEMKLLFAIGLYTGLRLGDCCTLKWGEVDLRRHQIKRIPNKMARRCPRAITIPIHPALGFMLAEIPANERGVYVLPKTASTYLSPAKSVITDSIQRHIRACGIETTEKRENGCNPIVRVGFHSLRHTFVSMCREANAPLSVVESIVGHSSVDMTRHYTHTSELAAQNAVALLPALTGDVATPSKPTGRTRDELLRELIKSMTPKNLREKKSAALAMLAGEI
jgi:integrase